MEELLTILSEIRPDIDFMTDAKLVDDKLLDSFTIVSVIGEISDHYDIEIPVEEIKSENFNSVAAMLEMIERLKEE